MGTKRASASGILALVDRIEGVATTLEKLCKCIYGNGKIGLEKEMVAAQEQLKLMLSVMKFCIVGIVTGILIPIMLAILSKIFHINIFGG